MSNLVDKFLGVVGKPTVIKVHVPELGEVGVRTSMLLGERTKFYAERTTETANALLLQQTVCDPETGNLVLSNLSLEEINALPTHVIDPLLDSALVAIGLKKVDSKEGDEELKNLETDQN